MARAFRLPHAEEPMRPAVAPYCREMLMSRYTSAPRFCSIGREPSWLTSQAKHNEPQRAPAKRVGPTLDYSGSHLENVAARL
jgi:hypothetical protein